MKSEQRYNAAALFCLLAFAGNFSGCIWGRAATQAPVVFQGQATKEQIISQVNANSSRVHQLESRLKLSVPGMPGIVGDLALERPRNLRLQAGFMGTSAGGIDLGSNNELFWLWVKSALGGQQPAVYFGNHGEYAQSRTRQAIPIDPSFLMDSLGMFQFAPDQTHEGPYPRPDGTLEIRSRKQSAAGETVHLTVIDSQRGNIVQQHLYSNGKLTASSYASNHEYLPDVQVSLPKKIRIVALPGSPQEMSLEINVDKYAVNELTAGAALWRMPEPGGVPVINVANGGVSNQLSLQKPSPYGFHNAPLVSQATNAYAPVPVASQPRQIYRSQQPSPPAVQARTVQTSPVRTPASPHSATPSPWDQQMKGLRGGRLFR